MSRIEEFRFVYCDAWGMIDKGYDSILEISDNGSVEILILVNSKPYKIPLTNKEEEFINDMCFLEKWNNKSYEDYWVMDGFRWSLLYAYDDVCIRAEGTNGYPKDFLHFLDLIHNKYNIPKADYESEESIKSCIKGTKVSAI